MHLLTAAPDVSTEYHTAMDRFEVVASQRTFAYTDTVPGVSTVEAGLDPLLANVTAVPPCTLAVALVVVHGLASQTVTAPLVVLMYSGNVPSLLDSYSAIAAAVADASFLIAVLRPLR